MRSVLFMPSQDAILVINCGSSSVKFALFSGDAALERVLSGEVDGIGLADGRMQTKTGTGTMLVDRALPSSDHNEALSVILEHANKWLGGAHLRAVGHRVVHGGDDCDCPVLVTTALEDRLRELVPLAPLHQPHNLAGIAAVRAVKPDLVQIACFDTAFHHTLPPIARLFALPRNLQEAGIRRYGFHGLSYEYVVEALRRRCIDLERERIVVAHLGNGASMCALRGGRSVETTMGFSTLAGLMMGTRSGDLDPGVVLYLLTKQGLSPEDIETLLYQRSGLLGVSGMSSDMRQLLAHQSQSAAREAVDLFCYQARHYLAALTATLGGLDRVVFTGGIGVNALEVRARICAGLAYLGIELDHAANASGVAIISAAHAAVTVEALASDEEVMIAGHVLRLIRTDTSTKEA